MKIVKRSTLVSLLFLMYLCPPAYAGDVKAEADRCLRWLEAFSMGQIAKAALISTEQLRSDDIPETYVAAQRDGLSRLYYQILQIGSGSPKLKEVLGDKAANKTGDILKRQVWEFGPNRRAFVGCVSYPGVDAPWHLVVKFEDNLEALTTKLETAAASRLSAPAEGK